MHKVAILELVAACVEHQPGLTQLLLDINPGVSLVVEPAPVLPAQLTGKHSVDILVFTPPQSHCLIKSNSFLNICRDLATISRIPLVTSSVADPGSGAFFTP